MNSKELSNKIHDLLIVRNDDGSYNLFGRYLVVPDNQGWFTVYKANTEISNTFSTLKNAVTWCVFDKNNKYKEIKRIHELDHLLCSINVNIAQHTKLALKSQNLEDKSIYLAKLYEDKLKKREMLSEINDYITTSKYLQSKKFEENKV